MKIFSFLLLIIFSANIQGQNSDLFITYDDEALFNKLVVKNSSTKLDTYIIAFKGKENPQYKFYVNEDGILMQHIKMLGDSGGSLTFIYEKNKNQNNDSKVAADEMKNVIKCEQIVYSKETDFENLFSKFNTIYLVNVSKKNGKYNAKKIKVIVNPGL